MGSRFVVNNVSGSPALGLDINDNIVELYNGRLNAGGAVTGKQIGEARVYNFSLEDAPQRRRDPLDLYLFDVQIFTKITLNVDATGKVAGFRIRGLSSNATGFVKLVVRCYNHRSIR